MNYEIVQLPKMMIAGIDVYTSNDEEFSANGKIPALWNRFYSEAILDKIPNKTNDHTIVAAYTDIETDEKGPYRFIIGTEVSSFKDLPIEFYKITIPIANYVKRITERGPFATIGIDCWKKIWSDKKLKSKRAYSTDIEIYDQRNMDQEKAQFNIFVGINGDVI